MLQRALIYGGWLIGAHRSLQGNLGLCGNLTDNLVNLIPPVNYADTSITTPCPDLCYEGAMVDNVHACPASQSSCVCPAGTK